MSALDASLVPRVSLRLGYRSRPIRICNDMSLSLLPFLSIFTGFQHKCLKVGTFGIIADFDCHLHQRLACLCISQFHLRPAPPPRLLRLSVPGVGHLQILHCPGAGHLLTPGSLPSFWQARSFLSEYNYTEGFTGKNADWLICQGQE